MAKKRINKQKETSLFDELNTVQPFTFDININEHNIVPGRELKGSRGSYKIIKIDKKNNEYKIKCMKSGKMIIVKLDFIIYCINNELFLKLP